MLTKHDYKPVNPDWNKETILDCCKTTPPGGTCSDCCYDTWSDELDQINPAYNEALENSIQLQNKVDFITGRRDKYKSWVDELDKAECLARHICHQLKLIAVQSDKIWYNACKAEEAIEILFCMTRDIFMQVDMIKTLYDSLQNCITRNTDPSLVKGQGILKYLDDYKVKLDATIKTRDDVIKNIVDAIRLSSLIRNNISTRDCCVEGEPPFDPCAEDQQPCTSLTGEIYYGFKTIICEWYKAFACDTACSDGGSQGSYQQQKQMGNPGQQEEHHEHCELIPTFEFPICNNPFRAEVDDWVKKDDGTLKTLNDALHKAKMKKEALLACKTSLDNAIKAVDPSTRCK